jgi:hypothetical protein
MFRTTGRLSAKSLIKEGENDFGKWQLVEFIIKKQYKKKQIKLVFVAFGKVADLIQRTPIKEKISITFFPQCKEYNGKYYTELKATEVEKWISQKKIKDSMKDGAEPLEEKDYTIVDDRPLFDKEE